MHRATLILIGIVAACSPRPEPVQPAPSPSVARVAESSRMLEVGPVVSDTLTLCVFEDGKLKDVPITLGARGDTLVGGRPLAEVYPPRAPYVGGAEWYLSGQPIRWYGMEYLRYGRARLLQKHEVVHSGNFRGVPVFVEGGRKTEDPGVIYFLVQPGCVFHPYMQPHG